MTLAEFLLARTAEDEERASSAVCSCGGPVCTPELGWFHMPEATARLDSRHAAEFVVAQSPARVLAECEAKRRIVGAHGADHKWCGDEVILEPGHACNTLRLLALPYVDHPDYRDEWRP